MTDIDEIREKVRRIQELRYSLITRDDWKSLKLVKNNLEHHDKKRCRVCDANLHGDKCWKCKYPASREYRIIQMISTNRHGKSAI